MDWLSGRLRCEQRSGRAPLTRLVLAIYADRYGLLPHDPLVRRAPASIDR
jgi:hypothetical protein